MYKSQGMVAMSLFCRHKTTIMRRNKRGKMEWACWNCDKRWAMVVESDRRKKRAREVRKLERLVKS